MMSMEDNEEIAKELGEHDMDTIHSVGKGYIASAVDNYNKCILPFIKSCDRAYANERLDEVEQKMKDAMSECLMDILMNTQCSIEWGDE